MTEYRALTEDVAIWDVAAERQVEIRGPDAAELAQYITCRDLSKQKVGTCLYAIICDDNGVVINDPGNLGFEYCFNIDSLSRSAVHIICSLSLSLSPSLSIYVVLVTTIFSFASMPQTCTRLLLVLHCGF